MHSKSTKVIKSTTKYVLISLTSEISIVNVSAQFVNSFVCVCIFKNKSNSTFTYINKLCKISLQKVKEVMIKIYAFTINTTI